MITYRLALAVFIRSPAAYEALKSFRILQLPSRQSLQKFTRAELDGPGLQHGYIQEQQTNYAKFCTDEAKFGRARPLGEGILIFDEVKVIGQVMWNSANHKFYGLAMSAEEFVSLNDIFAKNGEEEYPDKAQYMLQFYWRDLTSKFDVLGPYFPSDSPLDMNAIIGFVTSTIELLHSYGFGTSILVCDGASSNLAAIKLLCSEYSGALGTSQGTSEDRHHIKTWFDNPNQEGMKTFVIVCPGNEAEID